MAVNKTKETDASVAKYFAAIKDEARRTDCEALAKLMARATKHKPKMWGSSIVGFGSYHYQYESGREGDMPLAGFSPRKAAIVVYDMGFSEAEAFLAQLGNHTKGKGCLYIKKLANVDLKVLEALVAKSVEARRARQPD